MAKEIFLSHAWGEDELQRDNHLRVKHLYDLLTEKGYSVWLDQNNMIGNIDSSIIKGITDCSVVIICLTENYCTKINTCVYENTPNDNCYKEWNFSLFKQKKIIPVIMEPRMEEIFLKREGVIQMYLNNQMYINFSSDNDDQNDLAILYKTLRQFEVYNRNEKKFLNLRPNNSFDKFLDLLNLTSNKRVSNLPTKYTQPKQLNILSSNHFKKTGLMQKLFVKIRFNRPKVSRQKSYKFRPDLTSIKGKIIKI